jgi:hypothetical protein
VSETRSEAPAPLGDPPCPRCEASWRTQWRLSRARLGFILRVAAAGL